ncbi:MAG: cyclic nucleotide-binding domain-containing protein [Oscillospiraceae bacterium]|nr:cyclic nucleotide-binding domain-containing protein [Oscillospiraceae bacterium]
MQLKTFKQGEVIFREGDSGDCMYEVYTGKVGIVAAFGTSEQKLLAEYYSDHYFGEMGLLEKAPRSATAVAMADNTTVALITEDSFGEFFKKNPANVLAILQQMSRNLRKRTNEYVSVCRDIKEASEKEVKQ